MGWGEGRGVDGNRWSKGNASSELKLIYALFGSEGRSEMKERK